MYIYKRIKMLNQNTFIANLWKEKNPWTKIQKIFMIGLEDTYIELFHKWYGVQQVLCRK